MGKKIIIGLIVCISGAAAYASWLWFKPHEDVCGSRKFIELTAEQVLSSFENDAAGADSNMTGRVVQLTGKPAKLDTSGGSVSVSFDLGGDYIIQAYLDGNNKNGDLLNKESEIVLKCRYSGYFSPDPGMFLPGEIKFDRCCTAH